MGASLSLRPRRIRLPMAAITLREHLRRNAQADIRALDILSQLLASYALGTGAAVSDVLSSSRNCR